MSKLTSRDVFLMCLVVAIGTAYAVGGFAQRETDSFRYLFGNVGLLPFAAALGTLVMLIMNFRHQGRTLDVARDAERATRFQKAAELAGSGTTSAAVAGISMLRRVGQEDREAFGSAVINTLAAIIMEADRDIKARYQHFANPAIAIRNSLISDLSASRCLGAIAALNNGKDWPAGSPTVDGKLILREFYLGGINRQGDNLANIKMMNCVLKAVTFADCDFSHSRLLLHFAGPVTFENCRMIDTQIVGYAANCSAIVDPKSNLIFENSDITDVMVNGMAAVDWQRETADIIEASSPAPSQPAQRRRRKAPTKATSSVTQ